MKKTLYTSNISSNFSIGNDEFYLSPGDEIELPDHELIQSMCQKGYITKVEKPEKKEKK